MNRPRKRDRHLPARMYFKHGRHWYVAGGRWRKLAVDFETALAEYGQIIAKPRGGMDVLIDRVLGTMRQRLAANTILQYEIAAKKLKATLAEFAPDQVRSKHVAAIKLHHAKTPNMANRMLSFLRTVFVYAVEWQLVESNPCIGIRRHEEAKRTRYVTTEEFTRIRAVASPRLAAIMDLCYFTGQRISDVLAIRRTALTDEGIEFVQQKTGARLVVQWAPELRAAVQGATDAGGENVRALTLLHLRGRALSYGGVRDQFDRAAARAGVEDVTLHDLRAKSLTDADAQGKDPQKLGGHATRNQTERYLRQKRVTRAEAPSFRQSLDTEKKKA